MVAVAMSEDDGVLNDMEAFVRLPQRVKIVCRIVKEGQRLRWSGVEGAGSTGMWRRWRTNTFT